MHQTNNARFLDLLWRHVLSICLVTVALLVSYSRYGAIVCLMLSYSLAAFDSRETCSLSCVSDLTRLHCTSQSFAEAAALPRDPSNKQRCCVCVVLHVKKSQNQPSLPQTPIRPIAMLQPRRLTNHDSPAPCPGTPASAACALRHLSDCFA